MLYKKMWNIILFQMSKYWNRFKVSKIYYGKLLVKAAYKGTKLIWSSLVACFSSGFWEGKKFWKGSEPWKG